MSEFAETMSGHAQLRRQRRAGNRKNNTALLDAAGVAYEAKNGGAHLIVRHGGMVVDFWPGTGKFAVRGEQDRSGKAIYRRGVRALLQRLGVSHV